MNIFKKTTLFLIVFLFSSLYAKTIFVYNNSIKNTKDMRKIYDYEVLKLSLDKTVKKYGEYELVPALKMNKKRAIITAKSNKTKNFILKISMAKELTKDLVYANFPVDRGITGYRISFISPDAKEKIKDDVSIENIKKLKIGQGIGWLDSDILKHNGFNIRELSNYKGAFYMVSHNRMDLFSRGANEIFSEYERNKNTKGLEVDKKFVLYYPLPRFFFSHKSNYKAIKRIEEGLKIAYEDGSFDLLFNKYFKKSVDFVNLKDRKLYNLDNPFLEGVDDSYKKYIYNPFK